VTTRISDLQAKIETLKNVGLPTTDEETELAGLMQYNASAAPPAIAIAVGDTETVSMTVEVNREAFDRGGVGFTSPTEAGIYKGIFRSVQQSNQDANRYMFIFETTDPSLSMTHRSAINCSLVDRGGDFVLKDILENMGWGYMISDSGNGRANVNFSVTPDVECWLDYQEVTIAGKQEVRLQKVYQLGRIQQAV